VIDIRDIHGMNVLLRLDTSMRPRDGAHEESFASYASGPHRSSFKSIRGSTTLMVSKWSRSVISEGWRANAVACPLQGLFRRRRAFANGSSLAASAIASSAQIAAQKLSNNITYQFIRCIVRSVISEGLRANAVACRRGCAFANGSSVAACKRDRELGTDRGPKAVEQHHMLNYQMNCSISYLGKFARERGSLSPWLRVRQR